MAATPEIDIAHGAASSGHNTPANNDSVLSTSINYRLDDTDAFNSGSPITLPSGSSNAVQSLTWRKTSYMQWTTTPAGQISNLRWFATGVPVGVGFYAWLATSYVQAVTGDTLGITGFTDTTANQIANDAGGTLVTGSILAITAVSFSTPNTTYTYTLSSGQALFTGMTVIITGFTGGDTGNNGTFVINTLGSGTFTVTNSSGVTVTAAATGTVNADAGYTSSTPLTVNANEVLQNPNVGPNDGSSYPSAPTTGTSAGEQDFVVTQAGLMATYPGGPGETTTWTVTYRYTET